MTRLFKRLMNRFEGDAGGDSAGGGGETIGTGNDARVALLNSIGDNFDNIRADELADVLDDGSTTKFEPAPLDPTITDVDDVSGDPAPADPAPADPAPQPADDAPTDFSQMVTRTVNGKPVTKTLEQWLISASKVEAADEYLQQAALAKREVAPPPAQDPVAKGPTGEELRQQQDAERRRLARAIQMGTEDEAVAAIAELQNMAQTPTITVETIGRVADERLAFNTAISWFNDQFKDLVSDPILHQMVLSKDAEAIRNGDKRGYRERYEDIGNEVRAWKDGLIKSAIGDAPPVQSAPVANLDQRRAAKAAAPRVPTAANSKATPAQQADEDESPSAVIAQMAKSRGGPQWARG